MHPVQVLDNRSGLPYKWANIRQKLDMPIIPTYLIIPAKPRRFVPRIGCIQTGRGAPGYNRNGKSTCLLLFSKRRSENQAAPHYG
jgi:hypothetical protein